MARAANDKGRLFALIDMAEDEEQLRRSVIEWLGCTEIEAAAVADLQLRHLTRSGRERLNVMATQILEAQDE
jgi:DNA gyrase/topoisomerase IV subunit A